MKCLIKETLKGFAWVTLHMSLLGLAYETGKRVEREEWIKEVVKPVKKLQEELYQKYPFLRDSEE